MKVDRPDIAHWLLDYQAAGHDSAGPGDDREWLRGDSRLVVVAGSDTTAAAASFCFFRLCEDHAHVDGIRTELKALERTPTNTFNALDLQNDCPYLNAFIQEVLRLHPPVPGGFQRQTPPEGVTIASSEDPGKAVFIPGGVNVWMPIWTMGRCT
jgi:cytochrome P450